MNWAQPQVLVSHAARAHVLVTLPLALGECTDRAGPGKRLPSSQNNCRAQLPDPCSSIGPLLQCPPWQGSGPVGTSVAKPVGLVHCGDIKWDLCTVGERR